MYAVFYFRAWQMYTLIQKTSHRTSGEVEIHFLTGKSALPPTIMSLDYLKSYMTLVAN